MKKPRKTKPLTAEQRARKIATAAQWRIDNTDRAKEIERKSRLKNKDKRASQRKAKRAANQEAFRAKDRATIAAMPEDRRLRRNEMTRQWRIKNPEKAKASVAAWSQNNKVSGAVTAAKRRARKMQAMPCWVDLVALKSIYKTAKEMCSGNVPHVVDHIVPLAGKNVSGLHVPWNLRVITTQENARKKNKFIEALALAPTIANGLLSRK